MDIDPALQQDIESIGRIAVVKKILAVVCHSTGLGFSAIARVTDCKWIACAVQDEIAFGLVPGSELLLETTICHEIRQSGQIVVIDHVDEDPTFRDHPTPKMYGFQSYISVPINLHDGSFFGTLCAIDPRPARVNTPATIEMFKLFAELIAQHLETHERMAASEAALLKEREIAQFRDQFMAVLGHDLRNPLNAISTSADLLNMMPHNDDTLEVVGIIQRSAKRMVGLIDNVLDFARGTMGGGLSVRRVVEPDLAPMLGEVIQELQVAAPDRKLNQCMKLTKAISCDRTRIAQVLSNLLANAMTHGSKETPIDITARNCEDWFEMSVTNLGETIPADVIAQLFHPFIRGKVRAGDQGLGLGLYIASEIAKAHDGTLVATSVDGKTCFTFRMPVAAAV